MKTYTLSVLEIKEETKDVVTLCFKQPGLKKIKYHAGQYLTLIFRINGRRYLRPYSFSSAPGIDSFLEITVKRIPGGVVSNHIHDQVKVGDVIEVMEPMGDFIYEFRGIETLYFWGVGSGITPLISIIKFVLFNTTETKVVLVYGNRNFESTIFSGLIDYFLATYPGRFTVWHFHTKLTLKLENPYIVEGRISKTNALEVLNGIDAIQTRHFICGPVGLKESVKETLSTLKVPDANIYVEDFEVIKDPANFENIYTQHITLKFLDVEHKLEVIKGKSILEAALEAGMELPYSCQTGDCSTCKATLQAGTVKMIGLTKQRTDLSASEYLLCCTHPLTTGVSIEV